MTFTKLNRVVKQGQGVAIKLFVNLFSCFLASSSTVASKYKLYFLADQTKMYIYNVYKKDLHNKPKMCSSGINLYSHSWSGLQRVSECDTDCM